MNEGSVFLYTFSDCTGGLRYAIQSRATITAANGGEPGNMTRSMTRIVVIAVIVCAAIPILAVSGGNPSAADGDNNSKQPTLEALQTLIDDGDYAAALAQSEVYLEQHADNRDARFLHAVALAGLNRNEDAIKAFKTLAKDWPQRPEPANNLAALYARGGDYKKARKWLQKALNTQKVYAVA